MSVPRRLNAPNRQRQQATGLPHWPAARIDVTPVSSASGVGWSHLTGCSSMGYCVRRTTTTRVQEAQPLCEDFVLAINVSNGERSQLCPSCPACHLFTTTQIGTARNHGIDVVVNEVSNRATPCVHHVLLASSNSRPDLLSPLTPDSVPLASPSRHETTGFRNTIGGLKRLVGFTILDPDLKYEKHPQCLLHRCRRHC